MHAVEEDFDAKVGELDYFEYEESVEVECARERDRQIQYSPCLTRHFQHVFAFFSDYLVTNLGFLVRLSVNLWAAECLRVRVFEMTRPCFQKQICGQVMIRTNPSRKSGKE